MKLKFVDTRYGVFAIHPDPDLIGNSLDSYGEWAQSEIDILENFINQGDIVFDVGSYLGTHARAFSHIVGQEGTVHSFEPNPTNFRLLEENISNADLKNIIGHNFGLGRASAAFKVSSNFTESNRGGSALEKNVAGTGELTIKAIDELDFLTHIDFIKIDVEGMEIQVLLGAEKTIRTSRPIVFLEVNNINDSSTVVPWCESNEYLCFGFNSPAYNPNNFKRFKSNQFGSATECGVLLIPTERHSEYASTLLKLEPINIKTVDDIVLMLLHKPQYPNEVLAHSELNSQFDLHYSSPLSDLRLQKISDLESHLQSKSAKISELENQLQSKSTKISELENQLHERTIYIDRIEQSKIFRYSRPLANINYAVRQWRTGNGQSSYNNTEIATPAQRGIRNVIDIIVPVYRGLEDTKQCILSVLNSQCNHPWRLVVINDFSPEIEVTEWLRRLAKEDDRIELLENNQNLGFVGTVNRGMKLTTDRDVVLLNSDAVVSNDWLDRLSTACYANPMVATATPFSNNATICSYPIFCQSNDLPAGVDLSTMDDLCSKFLAEKYCYIPTAHGFCMYIRRDALNTVGYFDLENFGKGYGEENDFSLRATAAGWHHIHAWNVFVKHAGGVSFGASKLGREEHAMQTMRRLHPGYEALIHSFISRDPAAIARITLDIARLTQTTKSIVLLVSHNREGGTLRYIKDIAIRDASQQHTLLLRPVEGGGVCLTWAQSNENLFLQWHGEAELSEMVGFLAELGLSRVEYHHWLGHDPWILSLGKLLNVPTVTMLHDYYAVCPQLSMTNETNRYCGEIGEEDCQRCLNINPAPLRESIQHWRQRHGDFLHSVNTVITPNADVTKRYKKYFPELLVHSVPHEKPSYQDVRVLPLPPNSPLKVVVLGALSPIKGADVLEQVAIRAKKHQHAIDFHLFGYAYRSLVSKPKSNLTVHGPYEENELTELLARLKPDLAWFPTQCPETYSYTLSACLELGLPIVAGDIGAIAQRVQHRPLTWLHSWNSAPDEWLNHLDDIAIQLRKSEGLWQWPNSDTAETPEWKPPAIEPREHSVTSTISLAKRANLAATPIRDFNKSTNWPLKLLFRLRSLPILSWLVKLIPINTQRQVKNWLIK